MHAHPHSVQRERGGSVYKERERGSVYKESEREGGLCTKRVREREGGGLCTKRVRERWGSVHKEREREHLAG